MKKTAVFIAAAVIAAGAACSKQPAPSGKSGKITIIYTGNIGGKIEPCGCRIPKGGLARRATLLAAMKKETPDAVVLDSGALLYDSIRLLPPFEPAMRAKAVIAIEELKRTGIDGANVSAMDLADGADSLLVFGSAGFPWLSANIAFSKSGKLVFPPDTVKTAGEFKIGIFGFMDTGTLGVPFFDNASPLVVLDPREAVKREVEKLRKTCDLVVGLAYMDLPQVEKIAAEVPGIDLVIMSHTRSHNPGSEHEHFQPVKSGKTLVARCPDGGRVVGRLELTVVNGVADFKDAEAVKDLRPAEVREKDASVESMSTFRNSFTDLDYQIKSDDAVRVKVEEVMKVWERIEKAMKSRG